MSTRFLIFEGPPGAGKSTMAEFAADQLSLSGSPVEFLDEMTLDRVHFAGFLERLRVDLSDAATTLLAEWERVIDTFRADGRHFILDGAYFGNTMKYLLGQGMPLGDLHRLVVEVEDRLAAVDPVIINLTGDTGRIVRRAISERSDSWARSIAPTVNAYPYQQTRGRSGVDGMVHFFIDSYEVLNGILSRSALRHVSIDTADGNRSQVEDEVLKLIGVGRRIPPAGPCISPDRYVGCYQPPEGFPEPFNTPFAIEAVNGELRLHMVFCHNIRLVPESPTCFKMRASNLKVEFVLDEQDNVTHAVYPWPVGARFLCKRVSAEPNRPQWPESVEP